MLGWVSLRVSSVVLTRLVKIAHPGGETTAVEPVEITAGGADMPPRPRVHRLSIERRNKNGLKLWRAASSGNRRHRHVADEDQLAALPARLGTGVTCFN